MPVYISRASYLLTEVTEFHLPSVRCTFNTDYLASTFGLEIVFPTGDNCISLALGDTDTLLKEEEFHTFGLRAAWIARLIDNEIPKNDSNSLGSASSLAFRLTGNLTTFV